MKPVTAYPGCSPGPTVLRIAPLPSVPCHVHSIDAQDPEGIQYDWVMACFYRDEAQPVMFIACERLPARLTSGPLAADPRAGAPVLGLFVEDGHLNLGAKPDLSDLGVFTMYASALAASLVPEGQRKLFTCADLLIPDMAADTLDVMASTQLRAWSVTLRMWSQLIASGRDLDESLARRALDLVVDGLRRGDTAPPII